MVDFFRKLIAFAELIGHIQEANMYDRDPIFGTVIDIIGTDRNNRRFTVNLTFNGPKPGAKD